MALENVCKQRDVNTAVRNKKAHNEVIKLKNMWSNNIICYMGRKQSKKMQRRVLSSFLFLVTGHT